MSSNLTLQQRKDAFTQLGGYLLSDSNNLHDLIHSAHYYNAWFTPTELLKAVKAWGKLLNESDLNKWLAFENNLSNAKKVGLVLAGNIPLVGFHDILCVLASGHVALIKLSSQDKQLVPHLLKS